jgi:hypothetical protein
MRVLQRAFYSFVRVLKNIPVNRMSNSQNSERIRDVDSSDDELGNIGIASNARVNAVQEVDGNPNRAALIGLSARGFGQAGRRSINRRPATVHHQCAAGDVAGGVGPEEGDCARNFTWLTPAIEDGVGG